MEGEAGSDQSEGGAVPRRSGGIREPVPRAAGGCEGRAAAQERTVPAPARQCLPLRYCELHNTSQKKKLHKNSLVPPPPLNKTLPVFCLRGAGEPANFGGPMNVS